MDKEIKEDIETIKQFIDDSRHVVKEKGIYYILWGGYVILGTLISYLLGFLKLPHLIAWNWILLYIIILSFVLIREKGKSRKRTKTTFGETLQGGLWIGFMLTSLSLIIFSSLLWGLDLKVILAIICFMMGFVYWVNSFLIKEWWQRIFALCWWIGGIGMSLIPDLPVPLEPLVMCVFVLLFQILPGIYFMRKKN